MQGGDSSRPGGVRLGDKKHVVDAKGINERMERLDKERLPAGGQLAAKLSLQQSQLFFPLLPFTGVLQSVDLHRRSAFIIKDRLLPHFASQNSLVGRANIRDR